MKIGVVMTAKNCWNWTKAALLTIKSQHELFTVVVDDGSDDGETKPGLTKWQKYKPGERKVITDPPFDSLAGKWNIGILACWEQGCDYALVLNNDILLHPDTIDNLAERLSRGDVVMVTAHNVEGIFTENGIPPAFIATGNWHIEDPGPEAECPDFSAYMLSRECWEKVGPFDESFKPAYFEDNDYHERMVRKGLKAINLPSAPYYHYGSVTQDHDKTPDPEKHRRFELTRDVFVEKHGFVPHGGAVRTGRLKLLAIGDGYRETGFARVVHSVLERLVATGDYDVHHIAINHYGDPPGVPWTMYPAHLSNPPDPFGRGRVKALYDDLKPDAVFMVQDPWHIADYIRANYGMRGMVAYYPVDSPNLEAIWIAPMARCVEVCTYTRFGAEQSADAARVAMAQGIQSILSQTDAPEANASTLGFPNNRQYQDPRVSIPIARLNQLQDPDAYQVVPHGVDRSLFYEVGTEAGRKELGRAIDADIPQDWFLVGYVHRNQPRKRQDLMLRAFAKFITGLRDDDRPVEPAVLRQAKRQITDAGLVIHAAIDDHGGWDLHSLALDYGIRDRVMFTRPDTNQGQLSVADLNLLYNALDVNCNVGGGEGWGLSHIESGACRVAQIVPDWSATREIWDGAAELVPIAEVNHEQSLNTMQSVVSTDAVAESLLELYEDRTRLSTLADQAFAVSTRPEYSWDAVAKRFDGIIQRAAFLKGQPAPLVRITRAAA